MEKPLFWLAYVELLGISLKDTLQMTIEVFSLLGVHNDRISEDAGPCPDLRFGVGEREVG